MSTPVVVIGYIFLIPSIIGIAISSLLFFAAISAHGGKLDAGQGSALVSGFAIFCGVSSFVGGLFGWLLIMKKRVLQCSACGAVINAS
jgi:hypothetical protein